MTSCRTSRDRRLPGGIAGPGARRLEAASELRVEGIVAKRGDSPYRRGRTPDWLKIKTAAGKEIDAERAKWNE
jgi:ATP-dependent DNA ligase